MPIRMVGNPMSDWKDKESHEMFLVDVDALAGAFGGQIRSGAIRVNAEATDEDATLLLDLFNRGMIVSEAESVEDKKYAVPNDFSGDKLLRLKAASLISGDAKIVCFTSKAVRVIKTLVLAEQNAYTGRSVNKPYSLILAEAKARSANHSTLAFQKTAEAIKVVAQGNIPIPAEYMPGKNDPYVKSIRRTRRDDNINKNEHYIVRMFHVRGKWVVIAWNGRNELGKPLMLQAKGAFDSRADAEVAWAAILKSKSSYTDAKEIEHDKLLGTASSQPTASPRPAQPVAQPKPTTPKPTTPKPAKTGPAKDAPVTRPAELAKPVDSEPVEQFITGLEHMLSQNDEFQF